ncbi:hypothetical protein LIER_28478 [Lithospermum erythrorhizon]|uniref:Uncharacterized protein n=1 Tax=Lithospermum erythrorhizon TaxID=34254 RepID=A0AAV3RGZ4_LITER
MLTEYFYMCRKDGPIIITVRDQGKYLRLPSKIQGTKEVFGFVRNRVEERVKGWMGKLLSQAGKEVLLKSVTLTIPNCVMNYFKLPIGVLDEVNKTMASYWWAKSGKERGIH